MSSAVSAHPPGGLHQDPEPASNDQRKGPALGLTSATALVIGTVVGAGVFTMPAVLAAGGTVSLAVLAVIAVGAMVLATLFGQLTRRVPNADGGLYAYARHEFGDFAGYLTGWCYWVQAWAGNAAIVSSWVFYCDALFGIKPSGLGNWGIALVGLWIPAGINLAGIRDTAWLQNITVVLKYLPLLFIGVVGWFFVSKANFGAFNASGGSLYSAIGIAAGVALFSFIGVETAAITAKRVKDPRRNVGRASLLGTGAAAIVYLAVSAAVMGLVAHRALLNNGAPFVNAFETIFPHSAWAGKLVAALAAVSGFGALIGWTLVTAEVSRAPANDGLFPRPFGWTDRRGNAWFGIVVAAVLPSLLMLWRYTSSSGLTVFTYLVDLTVVTVAIPYLISACAQLTYLVSRRRPVQGWLLARDLSIAVAAALFSMWVAFAAGYSAVYQAMVVVLAGIILYAFVQAHRESTGQIPAPVDLTGGAGGRPPREPAEPPSHRSGSGRTVMSFSVQSEVGQLRQAIIHRPGLELSRPAVRAGPGVHPGDPGPDAGRPAPRAVRGPGRAAAGRVPDRRGAQGRPAAAAGQEPEVGHAAGR
jgi:APA family basic amino acid/polyamine antiporter